MDKQREKAIRAAEFIFSEPQDVSDGNSPCGGQDEPDKRGVIAAYCEYLEKIIEDGKRDDLLFLMDKTAGIVDAFFRNKIISYSVGGQLWVAYSSLEEARSLVERDAP